MAGLIREYFAARRSFITETVLAAKAYRHHALTAKANGYRVTLAYVGLPTIDECLDRIAKRVAGGGHPVPEELVRSRWARSHEGLLWFAQHIDEVDVFSNAAYGGPPKEVARIRNGALNLIDANELPAVTAVLKQLQR